MITANYLSDNPVSDGSPLRNGRVIAIGDIHGCATALHALIGEIQPAPSDTIITVGDVIDRGPDSRDVIDTLIALRQECHLVSLLGNHEEMLFSARSSHDMLERWLDYGGAATLASYGVGGLQAMPPDHVAFLDACRLYYETPTHFFIHANYDPNLPLGAQDVRVPGVRRRGGDSR